MRVYNQLKLKREKHKTIRQDARSIISGFARGTVFSITRYNVVNKLGAYPDVCFRPPDSEITDRYMKL